MLSTRQLGRVLGLSAARGGQLKKAGCAMEDEEAAKSWYLTYIRSRRRSAGNSAPSTDSSRTQAPVSAGNSAREAKVVEFEEDSSVPDGLDESLKRLRKLERVSALTLQKLLKAGRIAEAASMRAQHASVLKSLFDAELKVMRLAERRGELISVERALAMINSSFAELLITLRRLPDLGKTPEEKSKLEAFLAGCLEAMKRGAEEGFKKNGTATASEAQ